MKLAYAPRAVRDPRQIGTYYRTVADDRIAAAVAERIEMSSGSSPSVLRSLRV